jgi:hypothetical protein
LAAFSFLFAEPISIYARKRKLKEELGFSLAFCAGAFL